eukprot:GHVL01044200.1.p1 GENE.GHVL01044200.1~~GHVL01044200.1.p1  ORF type:complete len:375 (+),score=17.18 GHVL01044200.1:26-1126(+)
MWTVLLLLGYIAFAGLIIAVFFFGDPDGTGVLDFFYRLLFTNIPNALLKTSFMCCGSRGPAILNGIWKYMFRQKNPIVQIFYLAITLGGYFGVYIFGNPMIPGPYLTWWHKYSTPALVFIGVWIFYKASETSPGYVTKENEKRVVSQYAYDGHVFKENKCSTCLTVKPARSKHCSLCNMCVIRYDHHCIWVNNCIGEGNYRIFCIFLLHHAVLCLYGAFVGCAILMGEVKSRNLLNATFINPLTGALKQANHWVVFQYLLVTHPVIMCVALMCAIMGFVLLCFLLMHLRLAAWGLTSNESMKIRYSRYEKQDNKEDPSVVINLFDTGNTWRNIKNSFFPHYFYEKGKKLPKNWKSIGLSKLKKIEE